MGTYGVAHLPLDPDDPESKILSIDTLSDGDVRGAGIGLWCSSAVIREMSEAASMMGGSLFLRDEVRNPGPGLFCKDGYRSKQFSDRIPGDRLFTLSDAEHAAIRDAETLKARLEAGDFASAREHPLARMPLERKISLRLGLGGGAKLSSADEAWTLFICDGQKLSLDESAALCARHAAGRVGLGLYGNEYFWREGRFWCLAEVSGDGPDYYRRAVPLGLYVASATEDRGCYPAVHKRS